MQRSVSVASSNYPLTPPKAWLQNRTALFYTDTQTHLLKFLGACCHSIVSQHVFFHAGLAHTVSISALQLTAQQQSWLMAQGWRVTGQNNPNHVTMTAQHKYFTCIQARALHAFPRSVNLGRMQDEKLGKTMHGLLHMQYAVDAQNPYTEACIFVHQKAWGSAWVCQQFPLPCWGTPIDCVSPDTPQVQHLSATPYPRRDPLWDTRLERWGLESTWMEMCQCRGWDCWRTEAPPPPTFLHTNISKYMQRVIHGGCSHVTLYPDTRIVHPHLGTLFHKFHSVLDLVPPF